MKILGIGVDVVNHRRIQPLIKNQNFIKRIFGPYELKFSKNKLIDQTFLQKGLQPRKLYQNHLVLE